MILIKTRSSRLFVILLHLVGVSTNFPSTWRESGIVGVNTQSIVLESSDPLMLLNDWKRSYLQPHWIQDTHDQTCLGPMGGFSECGDATLWLIIPKQRRHARRRQWVRWATEDDDCEDDLKPEGYALQMVDSDSHLLHTDVNVSAQLKPPLWEDYSDKECLTRRRKDNKLVFVSCSQERAWSWQFNENGVLHFEKPKSNNRRTSQPKRLLNKHRTLDCIARNSTEAFLLTCNGKPSKYDDKEGRVVHISLVRQATSNSSQQLQSESESPLDDERIPHEIIIEEPKEERMSINRLPSHVDIAHIHASGPAVQAELRAASSRRAILTRHKESEAPPIQERPPLRFLIDTNPILLANGKSATRMNPKNDSVKPTTQGTGSSPKSLVRKIQVHPYIESSKDGVWTDPKTGLTYRTDLCNYLGGERKEHGRHTLTGVGQFMKTAFNIKVYGVALYVSKRDVLADPAMTSFASLSSEELRESEGFYSVLRHMASSADSNGGLFDRTLFIKTNMQLGLDTMQNSLQSDWKLLTPEAKDTLIGSSMKPRPVSDAMLSVVQSSDNPSKCSCAQTAPKEYSADPSCCARGTELVFTWRKDGGLEIRLNGDLMDSFHRPDIAAGIFFEYLRLDDPMSFDFLDNVVDGFPFLLAPLSQVKGVSSPRLQQSSSSSKRTSQTNHRLAKFIGEFGDALSSHASGIAGLVQTGATEVTNSAVNTARSVGGAARNLGGEVERRRELIGKHLSGFASSFYGRGQKSLAPTLPKWIENMSHVHIPSDEKQNSGSTEEGTLSHYLFRFFTQKTSRTALDEIVPMIHPATNATQRFFFGMVHLYLLLLLIVSFPAELSRRTKLIVVRKTAQALSDSELSDSEESFEFSPQKPAEEEKSNSQNGSGFRSFGVSRLGHVQKMV